MDSTVNNATLSAMVWKFTLSCQPSVKASNAMKDVHVAYRLYKEQ